MKVPKNFPIMTEIFCAYRKIPRNIVENVLEKYRKSPVETWF